MYRPGVIPSSTKVHSCELCNSAIRDESTAGRISCLNIAPNEHDLLVHVDCIAAYANAEAAKVVKSERMHVICPRLDGGGGPTTGVSNTLLRQLGLVHLLDPTNNTRGMTSSKTGRMPNKALKMAKEWADDPDIAKRILLAACPAKTGCGLTIECYKPPASGVKWGANNNANAAADKNELTTSKKKKKKSPTAEEPSEEIVDNQCTGSKLDGSPCPRLFTNTGGSADKRLCSRCLDKVNKNNAIAEAIVPLDKKTEASGGRVRQVNKAKEPAPQIEKKSKTKKPRGNSSLQVLLQSAAKKYRHCPSCGSKFEEETGGVLSEPSSEHHGEHLCSGCIEPLRAKKAARAAKEAKAEAKAEAARSKEVALQAAQLLAVLIGKMPNQELAVGGAKATSQVIVARGMLKEFYAKHPDAEAIVKQAGLPGFCREHGFILTWVPGVAPGEGIVRVERKEPITAIQPADSLAHRLEIPLPVEMYPNINWPGRIIGTGGATIRDISKKSKCKVAVRGFSVVIEGPTQKALDLARWLVEPLIKTVHSECRSEGSAAQAASTASGAASGAALSQEAADVQFGAGWLDDTASQASSQTSCQDPEDIVFGSNDDQDTPPGGGGGGGAPNEREKRIDPQDGQAYTKLEFFEEYGGLAEWHTAKPVTSAEVQAIQAAAQAQAIQAAAQAQAMRAAAQAQAMRAAAEAQIKRAKEEAQTKEAAAEAAVEECPICLESLEEGTACSLGCGHVFHFDCISSHRDYTGDTLCPTCNQDSPSAPRPYAPKALRSAPPPPPPPTWNPTPALLLLQENKVAEANLVLLSNHGLVTPEAIMAAHRVGLAQIGLKQGPLIRVLKIISALLLVDEDAQVKQALEECQLGKYRAKLASDQFDLDALRYFTDQDDETLKQDLEISDEDIPTFRSMMRNL